MASVAELNVLIRLMTALAAASRTSTADDGRHQRQHVPGRPQQPAGAIGGDGHVQRHLQRQRRPQADLLVHVHHVVVDVVERLVGQRAQPDRQRRPHAQAGQGERDEQVQARPQAAAEQERVRRRVPQPVRRRGRASWGRRRSSPGGVYRRPPPATTSNGLSAQLIGDDMPRAGAVIGRWRPRPRPAGGRPSPRSAAERSARRTGRPAAARTGPGRPRTASTRPGRASAASRRAATRRVEAGRPSAR